MLHLGVELVDVDGEPVLATDKLCQVEGESVGVIEGEGAGAVDFSLAGCFHLGHHLVEQADTGLEGAQEGFLLLLHHLLDECLLGLQLGICATHVVDEDGQEAVHEGLFLTEEGVAIAHGTAQDAADDVSGLGIGGQLAIGDGEGNGADVVGNDAHGHIGLAGCTIVDACQLADGTDDGLEDIGVVVRSLSLQGHTEALEAHAGVNHLGGQTFERAVGLAVVLHEHEVPYFDYLRMIVVHQVASAHLGTLFGRTEVDVNL